MTVPIQELEGTWEEVSAHAIELAGKRVRLLVLNDQSEGQPHPTIRRHGTVEDLNAFLNSLPDLGSDADVLWESIAANRHMRRSLVEKRT